MENPLSGYASPEAFEISNEMLLEALSHIDEGVLIADDQGVIVFYNRFHGVIDGLVPEQVLGKKITEVYTLSEKESLAHRCLATGQPISQEYISYKPRNGVVVSSINSLYPIRRDNKIVGCLSLLKDYKVSKTLIPLDPPAADLEFGKKVRYTFRHIKGEARHLLMAITMARKAAESGSSVMIYGETGTGKEMFAQAIHNAGRRREQTFVAVNCTSIPETLFEGLLFGTRKGAFTGSVDQKGLFEQANGGTLFLDEIDSMPVALQTKMLRAIQEKKIRRVGDLEEIPIDVRIISCTSTSPSIMIHEQEKFRKDLFYRLAVVLLPLPPLRDREDDVDILTGHFLSHFNRCFDRHVTSVSDKVLALFRNYDWPGNIRELAHVIEGAMNLLDRGHVMDIAHVAPYFNTVAPAFIQSQQRFSKSISREPVAVIRECMDRDADSREKEKIEKALSDARGKINTAAGNLGISRQLLYYRIKKHRIDSKAIADAWEADALEQALAACGHNLSRTAAHLGISLQLLNYRMKKHGIRS